MEIHFTCVSVLSKGVDRTSRENLLYPDELPTNISVGNFLATINYSHKHSAIFAEAKRFRNAEMRDLEDNLRRLIFDNDHSDRCDSYLFTGQDNTISFWRHQNQYYVFNSHGVDETNKYTHLNPKARFVQVRQFRILGFFTFTGKIRVVSEPSLQFTRVNTQPTQREAINNTSDLKLRLQPVFRLERINTDVICGPRKVGRPVKQKRGVRVRSAVSPNRENDVAVNNYLYKDRKLNMLPIIVIEKNKIVEDKICRLTNKNIKKYNPKVNRDAVKRYTAKNPSFNQDAVKRYTVKNPIIHQTAVRRYTAKNPIVNQTAVQRYTKKKPSIHRDAVQKYSENNPYVNKEASQRYNIHSRNLEPALRHSSNLIGQKRDDQLDVVPLYTCTHCRARLFFQEKGRLQWCCGTGAHYVQHFPPLTEDFYHHPSFILRPRAYNNLFSFSAIGVSYGYQHPASGISFLKIQGRVYHRVFDLAYTDTTNPIGLYIDDTNERERLAAVWV